MRSSKPSTTRQGLVQRHALNAAVLRATRERADGVPPDIADLVARGAPLEDESGESPLFTVVTHGHEPIMTLFIASGRVGDLDALRPGGEGPLLHLAVMGENPLGMIRLLRQAGASVDARNRRGDTPLISAAKYGKKAACEALLDEGADVHAVSDSNRTAWHEAASSQHAPTAYALLVRGADPTRGEGVVDPRIMAFCASQMEQLIDWVARRDQSVRDHASSVLASIMSSPPVPSAGVWAAEQLLRLVDPTAGFMTSRRVRIRAERGERPRN